MNQVSLLCDNESTIKISYNPYEHSRTKHKDIVGIDDRGQFTHKHGGKKRYAKVRGRVRETVLICSNCSPGVPSLWTWQSIYRTVGSISTMMIMPRPTATP
jgi:hypothetical protein